MAKLVSRHNKALEQFYQALLIALVWERYNKELFLR